MGKTLFNRVSKTERVKGKWKGETGIEGDWEKDEDEEEKEEGQSVAMRHHKVNGSLALLLSCSVVSKGNKAAALT